MNEKIKKINLLSEVTDVTTSLIYLSNRNYIFSENYYSIIHATIAHLSISTGKSYIIVKQELYEHLLKNIEIMKHSNLLNASFAILYDLLLYPFFNIFKKNKFKYSDYNIDINYFMNFDTQNILTDIQQEYSSTDIVHHSSIQIITFYTFKNKKLKSFIVDIDNGILNIYINYKLSTIVFADNSEINIPKDL